MIEKLTYEELLELSNQLSSSSKTIREIVNQYGSELTDIESFCDSVDSYSSFLESSVTLYKDSDHALEFLIQKNK